MKEGSFCWYELMTSDQDGAQAFYQNVAGWSVRDAGMPGMRYLLACVGERQVAGIMAMMAQDDAMQPAWFGYVCVADVDAKAQQVTDLGGAVHRGPMDIPGVGRFAVVADPQGAPFMLFRGNGEPMELPPMGTPGYPGWHELHSSDWQAAFGFYERLFGWSKNQAVDMGPMGIYQTFQAGDTQGGMMDDARAPHPYWLYYISVDDIDAAHDRLVAAGGTVQAGPHEVPGGAWIINAVDPQGAQFALTGPKKG